MGLNKTSSLLNKAIIRIKNYRPAILVFAILCFILRSVYPFYKYLFFITIVAYLTLFFTSESERKFHLLGWLKTFKEYVLVLIIFSVFTFIDHDIFLIKQYLNGLIVFVLVYVLAQERFDLSIQSTFKLFIGLVLLILFNAFIFLFLTQIGTTNRVGHYGISLVDDYNMFAMILILGLIALLMIRKLTFISKLFSIIALIPLYVGIFLSYSRRGIFILIVLSIIQTLFLLFKRNNIKGFIKVCLVFVPIILGFIFIKIEIQKIPNTFNPTNEVYSNMFRFNNIIFPNDNFESFYYRLLKLKSKNNHIEYGDNLFQNGEFKEGLKYWRFTGNFINQKYVQYQTENSVRINKQIGDEGSWSLVYTGPPLIFHKACTYELIIKYKSIKGSGMPFRIGWYLPNGDGANVYEVVSNIQPKHRYDSLGWTILKTSYTFNQSHLNPIGIINSQEEGSIIEISSVKLLNISKINESDFVSDFDLKWYESFANWKGADINKKVNTYSSRLYRWQFALELWQTKYKWYHKIFGHGFDYLEWYGQKFYNDPKRYDYPHNPIISSFLYSGIIGGLFYIYFLTLVFWYYWKFRKHQMVFFLMYVVTFFFMMFSGNSHFSVPIFTFLSLVPFVTKYYINSGKIVLNDISRNSNNSNI